MGMCNYLELDDVVNPVWDLVGDFQFQLSPLWTQTTFLVCDT